MNTISLEVAKVSSLGGVLFIASDAVYMEILSSGSCSSVFFLDFCSF